MLDKPKGAILQRDKETYGPTGHVCSMVSKQPITLWLSFLAIPGCSKKIFLNLLCKREKQSDCPNLLKTYKKVSKGAHRACQQECS